MSEKLSHKGFRQLIREYSSRPGGCTLHDIPGMTGMQVANNAYGMPDIYRVGVQCYKRLFTSKAEADEYEGVILPKLKAAARQHARELAAARFHAKYVPKPRPKKEPKPKAAPKPVKRPEVVTIPKYTGPKWDKGVPAIQPPHVVKQVLPGHPGYDARFSLPPGTIVRGEFSRIPLGGTLA
jgi:hypothetical protein